MSELTIGDNVYRTGKINAMTQFHLVRRLLPLISGMAPDPNKPPDVGSVLTRVVHALSEMSDEDCNYIVGKCLEVCRRKQGESWAPVWNSAANNLQFQDIDMPAMMTLTMATLEENLGSFLPALPSQFPSANPEPNTPSNL